MTFVLRNQYASRIYNEIDFWKYHTNFMQNTITFIHRINSQSLLPINMDSVLNLEITKHFSSSKL